MLTGELRHNKKRSNLANLLGECAVYHHACRLSRYKHIGNHFRQIIDKDMNVI